MKQGEQLDANYTIIQVRDGGVAQDGIGDEK